MNLEQALFKVAFLSDSTFSTAKDAQGEITELRFTYYGVLNRHKLTVLLELAEKHEMDFSVKRSGPGLSVKFHLFVNDTRN